MKFRKIAACAAAIMCAAAMTVSTAVTASAKLTAVGKDGYTLSEEKSFLVMLYSDGTYDASTKNKTNYGIDCTTIKTVEVTLKAPDDFTGDFGGAIVMSSKSASDASSHNWNSIEYWGVTDEDLGIDTAAASKGVVFKKTGDHTYTATVTLEGNKAVIEDYNFVQFAIQDWGGDTMTVQSIVMKDASGNTVISFDSKGKASLPLVTEDAAPAAEETTAAETEAPAEETTEAPAEVDTPDEPEADEEDGTTEDAIDDEEPEDLDEALDEDDDEDIDDADADEDAVDEYVSTFDPSTVLLADTVTDEYFDGTYLYLRDENGLDALDKGEGLDVTSVYGVRFILDYDEEDVANGVWFGGGIGANSNSTGWKQFGWSYTEGEQDLTLDLDTKSITWLSDAPIFAADDTYCQLWLQNWGGNWGVQEVQMLDASGNVIDPAGAAPTVIAPAPTTGDVAAATDSSKGSPDTGVADVAAVAGLAVVAAGAVIVAKKRK